MFCYRNATKRAKEQNADFTNRNSLFPETMSVFITVWKASRARTSAGDTFKRVPIRLSGFFCVYPECRFQIFNMKTISLTCLFISFDKQDKFLSAQKPEGTALAHDDSGLVRYCYIAVLKTGNFFQTTFIQRSAKRASCKLPHLLPSHLNIW